MRTIAKAVLFVAFTATACLPPHASALELLQNGGFESGFASWTRIDQTGGDGSFFLQTGTTSPVNLFTVPAPPQGTFAAMTDQQGPGSHLLFQDFVVPTAVPSATLSFMVFVNSMFDFATPGTLDFSTPAANQQARVDLLLAGANAFTLAASDLLLNAFITNPGDPLTSGYALVTIDVTALLNAHLGETLRLRFAEVDNQSFFNLGVDDVRLTVGVQTPGTVPEPAPWLLAVAALLAWAIRRTPQRSA